MIASGAVIVAATQHAGATDRAEPNYVAVEAGRFDLLKDEQPASAFGAEYRSGELLWWKLRPFAGVGLTSRESVLGYGGVRLPTYWAQRLVVTPSFAIGGYRRGRGKELGQPPVVGRTGLDLEYTLGNAMRLGLAYHHLSNGKVFGQSVNPGTQIVGVTLALPLR